MKQSKKTIYEFCVTLIAYDEDSKKKKITRMLELEGDTDLYHLARSITKAYDFDFDHLFQFQDYIKRGGSHKEVYVRSCDAYQEDEKCNDKHHKAGSMWGNQPEFHARGALLKNIFTIGKQLEFWFDFGDDWKFDVKCIAIHEREDGKKYPQITKKVGLAPQQYPDYD